MQTRSDTHTCRDRVALYLLYCSGANKTVAGGLDKDFMGLSLLSLNTVTCCLSQCLTCSEAAQKRAEIRNVEHARFILAELMDVL